MYGCVHVCTFVAALTFRNSTSNTVGKGILVLFLLRRTVARRSKFITGGSNRGEGSEMDEKGKQSDLLICREKLEGRGCF